jgi:hypothetical protein
MDHLLVACQLLPIRDRARTRDFSTLSHHCKGATSCMTPSRSFRDPSPCTQRLCLYLLPPLNAECLFLSSFLFYVGFSFLLFLSFLLFSSLLFCFFVFSRQRWGGEGVFDILRVFDVPTHRFPPALDFLRRGAQSTTGYGYFAIFFWKRPALLLAQGYPSKCALLEGLQAKSRSCIMGQKLSCVADNRVRIPCPFGGRLHKRNSRRGGAGETCEQQWGLVACPSM